MASFIINDRPKAKSFAIHPAGTFAARCVQVVDLGTTEKEFKGEFKKQREVMLGFETSELMGSDAGPAEGKPMVVIGRYTLSLNEKSRLSLHLEGWRGRKFTKEEREGTGFDLSKLAGAACLLNVIHNTSPGTGKTYANIGAMMPLPTGMRANPAVSAPLCFNINEFSQLEFDSLTDYWKGEIAKSDEFNKMNSTPAKTSPAPAAMIEDGDIPF